MSLVVATTVEQALAAMAAGARPIAGGTDLVVAARHGKAPLPDSLVAIDRIVELGGIEVTDTTVRIGAAVNHHRLMTDPAVEHTLCGLADAAALIGSPATRNVGTIGGNIMNASPAMDTGAPLVVLGASAELRSRSGTRLVPMLDLWVGPGQTTARLDELCTAVVLPNHRARTASGYVRLEYRRAMEIAVVGAAAWVQLNDESAIVDARIALTAVGPTITELHGLGDLTVGWPLNDDALDAVQAAAAEQATPISDLRASDTYRRHCVGVMARRALKAAVGRASGEAIGVPLNHNLGIGA